MKYLIKVLTILLIVTFAIAQQNGCILLVPGTLKCQVCSSSFQLDDLGNCRLYTPIEGCDIYNSALNGAECSTCSKRYVPYRGKCFQMIANCQTTQDINTCNKCVEGYTVIEYSNCYSLNVQNCPLGSLPRTAYGLNFCQQFNIINCQLGTSQNKACQQCNAGYTPINGICFAIQSSFNCPGNSCLCKGYFYKDLCYIAKLSNCLRSQNNIYCNICADGYFAEKGICLKYIKNDDINCNVLTQDRTRCQGCDLGYFLNSNYICVKDFQLCPFGCTSCPQNFQLYKENCYYHDPFCKVYDFDTANICTLCIQGYRYDSRTLKCLRQTTCQIRNQQNICTRCFSGYQLNIRNLQCQQLPNNCIAINLQGFCTNCAPGTTLKQNNCIFMTTNCSNYNTFGFCQICDEGYVQVQRRCIQISRNCLTFNSDRTKCDVCQPSFRLFNSQCFKIIEGCLSYFLPNRCQLCQQSYLLLNGLCYYDDPNCLSYNNEGICIVCKNGYLPYASKCVFYNPYCLEYDPINLHCTRSMNGFTLGEFSTAQKINYQNMNLQANLASGNSFGSNFNSNSGSSGSGSSSSSGSGSSSSSGSGSSSSSGGGNVISGSSGGASSSGSFNGNGHIISLPYSGLNSIYMRSYSLNGIIMSCNNGLSLINMQCVVNTINCQRYNQYGRCQQCNPGYDLLSDYSCSLRSLATCLKQTGGVCLQAAQGFVVINGAAYYAGNNINQNSANQLIITAKSGYFVYSAYNIAWPYDFNCAHQLQPRKCLRCISHHFTLQNDICIIKRLRCLAYSPYGICLGCQQGFMLFAGYCRISNCALVDPNTNLCNSCQADFNIQTGICFPRPINNCQIYNRTSCINCKSGFYLTGNLCARMIDFCQLANNQTGRCSQCIFNYTFFQQKCIPMIENCFRYSQTPNVCANCTSLYYPILNNSTCSYLGHYCAALNDQNQCITCRPNLTLRVQRGINICIRPIANCFQYDASIKCIRCNSGFVIQFNRCKSIRCFTFNLSKNACQSCNTPYRLSNGYCLDPNCQVNEQQKCITCYARFYLNGSECVIIPDPFCRNYSSNGRCLSCFVNYSPNQNGVCILNDTLHYGCQKRQFPCTKCAIGYYLNQSLCYARKCTAFKSNRDCVSCINYYNFQSTQRFCILYTCSSPICYQNDNPPQGFQLDLSFTLKIRYCVAYNGADCIQCQSYRFPNRQAKYNLCYPYNCKVSNSYNCISNCITHFSNSQTAIGSCLADFCLSHDSTGKCLQCIDKYQRIDNSYCVLIQLPLCLVVNYQTLSCQKCIEGFELINNICRNSFCQIYQTANISLCSTCMRGYIYNRAKNICQVGKCSRFINYMNCSACILGYTLRNNLCEINNCIEVIWQTLMCKQCAVGYEIAVGVGICKASNCQTFDNFLNCRTCLNNGDIVYQLRNGICVSVDPNCLRFDSNGNCLACRDVSLFTHVADICVNIVIGCVQYNRNGCVRCAPAYALINGQCSVRNCVNFTSPARCSICNFRFDLRPNFTCAPKNCLLLNSQLWRCDRCQPRFYLINGYCFTFNCSKTLATINSCQQCFPGFTLIQDTCVFNNCPSNQLFSCPSCITGYNLIDGVCKANRTGCLNYNQNTFSCLTCISGYNLTLTGYCTLIIIPDPYCTAYNIDNNLCTQCLTNFVFNGESKQCQSRYCIRYNNIQPVNGRICTACLDQFTFQQTKRYCIPIYCKLYSLGIGSCTSCVGGSALMKNICYPNNCASYSLKFQIAPVCLSCDNGYNLSTNMLCIPNNCQSYDPITFVCIKCISSFILNNNRVCINSACKRGYIFQNFRCVPANCNNYSTGRCTQCFSGFITQLDGCIPQGCMVFNDRYECKECRKGYKLVAINGQFICSLNQAQVCPSGYYLSNQICILIPIKNCIISDSTGNQCLKCLPGFLLRDKICYSYEGCDFYSSIDGCRDCIQGFVKQGFICYSLNCETIFPNNTCQTCRKGYDLINGACRQAIYKCLRIDNLGNCVQCQSGFDTREGKCIAKGCASYSPVSYVCLTCLSGYSLNGELCILIIQLPNCFQSLNATYCRRCNNNYIELKGICYIQIPFCSLYNNNNGSCSICNSGYYLNQNFRCSLLPSNCLTADNLGNCVNCIFGYFVFNKQCRPNIPNCKSFDPFTSNCIQCLPTYYLNNNVQCIKIPDFCVTADSTGACTSCIAGYTISRRICVKIIAFCSIYHQNTVNYCFQCMATHYLNVNYTCTILPNNCLSANNIGNCLTCMQGFIKFSTFCVKRVNNCLSYIQWNQDTRCQRCIPGFTLNRQYQCTNLPLNCQALDFNGRCSNCIINYQLFSGICVTPVPFCQSYNISSYFCSKCVSGYYLSNRMANTFYCQELPQFCLTANLNGQCLNCLPNYIPYNFLCVLQASIINCKSYDIRTFICLQCNPRYYLNNVRNICTILPDNCNRVNHNNGFCLECLPGFKLQGQQCVYNISNCFNINPILGVCNECAPGYELSSDFRTCNFKIINCKRFGANNICLECIDTYYLIEGLCYLLPDGCMQLNNQRICIACRSNYVLSQRQCIISIQFCASYNNRTCSQCIPNYYLLNNICYPFPDNCAFYNNTLSRCTACASGFSLDPFIFICHRTIINCVAYNRDGRCLSCLQRFYLNQNRCLAYPNFCVNIDLRGNCLSCSFGCTLSSNNCIPNNGRQLNCLVFNPETNICSQCIQGYNLCGVLGICLLSDPGCQQFTNDGRCINCKSLYQLHQGRCIQYPTGLILAPNGGASCATGYTLKQNSCIRSTTTLTRISDISINYVFSFSSNNSRSPPFINRNTFWSPSTSQQNEYISVASLNNKPQIIFQLDIKGNSQGWVSAYIIQFKNRVDAPFICWNSCNQVIGNKDGQNRSILQLTYPIIASELRIYPVRWQNQINMQLQIWILKYN